MLLCEICLVYIKNKTYVLLSGTETEPKISKGVKPFRCLQEKRKKAFKGKGTIFLDRQGLIPFQISSAWQHTLHHCSSPYLSFESVLLSNFNPLSVAGRLNGFLPVGLMSPLPFRNRTKLPPNVAQTESGPSGDCERCWHVGAQPSPIALHLISITFQCTGFCKTTVWALAAMQTYGR